MLAVTAAAIAPRPCRAEAAAALEVLPAVVRFSDPYQRRQLLATSGGRDVTQAASFTSDNSAIVRVEPQGYLVPVAAGSANVRVQHAGAETLVPVTIEPLDGNRPVDFQNEVNPLLTRLGCNSGGCHGKAGGQNGFRLSLFGFDPQYDYESLVSQARGRRVSLASPSDSLLLRKSTAALPHGGGRKLAEGSEEYDLLLRWIAQGAPQTADTVPSVSGISIAIAERVLERGASQQLAVVAHYSDGSERDVTRAAQYHTNLETVAVVSDTGLVTAAGRSGEAAIMSRYQNKIAVFRAIVPHGPPLANIDFPAANYIDTLSVDKWKKLGLRPSPLADDATFVRRVTVDLCGRLPTAAEARAYVTDPAPDKRTTLVDRLLASPDYPAYFAMRWGSILRNSNQAGADQAAYAFHNWIKDMIARNRPYDEFVRGVVAASGEWQDAPAINWYWQMRDNQLHQPVGDTAQVFLGLRIQCAQCHHHPYERWSQDDYLGFSGFFTRLGRKSFGQPPPYFASATRTMGEPHPKTRQVLEPKYLDGPEAKFTRFEDPRHGLVDWMAKPDNPFFAQALVNRLWGHFMGRGLVEPVDDMRETNPPANPALLAALAKDFVDHKFDFKHIVRTIALSNVYALDSAPTESNAEDSQNFARFYARRVVAEVFLDSVDQACGTRSQFGGIASTGRAIDLPHEAFGSYFLDTFDRPKRLTGCECERSAAATLSQVLLLANSDEIENKIADGNGRVASLLKTEMATEAVAQELYLAALSRFPTATEATRVVQYVESVPADKRRELWEDVLWTLINSKEFSFNR